MLRRWLATRSDPDPGFRWRTREILRIEGLSDAIIGFGVTLLVVSLEVPKTSEALLATMGGFVAFGLAFGILIGVWYGQFKFFRRYGLEDRVTVTLVAAQLFVVMLFLYPLKFLIASILAEVFGFQRDAAVIAPEHHAPLLALYGLGLSAVASITALLHVRAWLLRGELGLDGREEFETREVIRVQAVSALTGVLLCGMAAVFAIPEDVTWRRPVVIVGGLVLLVPMVVALIDMSKGKERRERYLRQQAALVASPPASRATEPGPR